MTSLILAATGHASFGAQGLGVRDLARFAVLLAIVASGIVFTEPAPVDLLMIALIALLPLAGLQTYTASLGLYLMLWLICGTGAVAASAMSADMARSAIHTGVSFYLYVSSFVLAAFIANRPDQHTRLILNGYAVAALIAALTGIAGYFHLIPGAFELFTKFGRATGTFKDPNVFGPFLIPIILYCAHVVIAREAKRIAVPLGLAAVLLFALLLSFSRGAWLNFAIAALIYGYVTFVTTRSVPDRRRMLAFAGAGLAAMAIAVIVALQFDAIADLLAQRSSLSQSYDVGPDGRFGGHEKAKALLLLNPLGLGANQFGGLYHSEDVHNVYLSMFLNAGWLGGLFYLVVIGLTLALAGAHMLRSTRTRPLFLIAFAALVGNVVEGVVIDTDHWRHFYLLLAIVWGLMAADERTPRGRIL